MRERAKAMVLREGHRRSHISDLESIPKQVWHGLPARESTGGCPILAQQGWGTDRPHDVRILSVPHPSQGAKDGAPMRHSFPIEKRFFQIPRKIRAGAAYGLLGGTTQCEFRASEFATRFVVYIAPPCAVERGCPIRNTER